MPPRQDNHPARARDRSQFTPTSPHSRGAISLVAATIVSRELEAGLRYRAWQLADAEQPRSAGRIMGAASANQAGVPVRQAVMALSPLA
ncbi:hypothetical protein WJX74_004360 [Apatococcus lobatus]|uniref:Uncharacterized protein n=1 Tax=Apatococcus lobatus TaxID=904363 RepID=A0AAW1QV01_9CHLO